MENIAEGRPKWKPVEKLGPIQVTPEERPQFVGMGLRLRGRRR
jgi:hypothetical protein